MSVTLKNTLLKNTPIRPWSPLNDLNDLLVWYDLKDASTVTANGGNLVSQVDNKANVGTYDATQSSEALKPTYTTYNGLPCLQCDEDAMSMGTLPAFSVASGGYTIFVVCRYNAVGSFTDTMLPYGLNTKNTYKPSNSSGMRSIHYASTLNSASILDTTPTITTNRWDGATLTAYIDGVLDANSISVSSTIPSNAWYFCSSRSDGLYGIQGNIFEFLVYDKNLTDAGISAVHSYLTNKWGIS